MKRTWPIYYDRSGIAYVKTEDVVGSKEYKRQAGAMLKALARRTEET